MYFLLINALLVCPCSVRIDRLLKSLKIVRQLDWKGEDNTEVENKPYIEGTQMSLYKLAGDICQYKMLANSDNFQFSLSPTFFAVVDTHCQLKHL